MCSSVISLKSTHALLVSILPSQLPSKQPASRTDAHILRELRPAAHYAANCSCAIPATDIRISRAEARSMRSISAAGLGTDAAVAPPEIGVALPQRYVLAETRAEPGRGEGRVGAVPQQKADEAFALVVAGAVGGEVECGPAEGVGCIGVGVLA